MTNDWGPTLTEAKGMGGVIALQGFDYQLWDGLARLPAWLRNPGFEGMIFESLEDLEARFFAPHAPRRHLLERYQAKSGALTRGDLIDVLNAFRRFEANFPQAARLQTLVTPGLRPSLSWLARNPDRVRRARPFYAPFADIRGASDAKVRADLIEEFGGELGVFFDDTVEIALRSLPDRAHAISAFNAALGAAFTELDVTQRRVEAAFDALSALARRSIGVMLPRGALVDILERELSAPLPRAGGVFVHVRSDRNAAEEDAIEIDASAFSGGHVDQLEPAAWTSGLLEPLGATARWARAQGHIRIALSGSYRLSTAFALGWSFRAAIGFELDIPTRAGTWATDDRPTLGAAAPSWELTKASRLNGENLVATVGVLHDPACDVANAGSFDVAEEFFTATLPHAIGTAAEAQASAAFVKTALAANGSALGARRIDLYFAGPAAFAVALGHRWNALPTTQFHEYIAAERRYVPTVRLG